MSHSFPATAGTQMTRGTYVRGETQFSFGGHEREGGVVGDVFCACFFHCDITCYLEENERYDDTWAVSSTGMSSTGGGGGTLTSAMGSSTAACGYHAIVARG